MTYFDLNHWINQLGLITLMKICFCSVRNNQGWLGKWLNERQGGYLWKSVCLFKFQYVKNIHNTRISPGKDLIFSGCYVLTAICCKFWTWIELINVSVKVNRRLYIYNTSWKWFCTSTCAMSIKGISCVVLGLSLRTLGCCSSYRKHNKSERKGQKGTLAERRAYVYQSRKRGSVPRFTMLPWSSIYTRPYLSTRTIMPS